MGCFFIDDDLIPVLNLMRNVRSLMQVDDVIVIPALISVNRF